ncbi:ATP-binding cassette domain-containing protein [Azospirillum formosense]|uniref:ATP-binding cassette domain-containing protein n=1 Tax=Azospirillum formosense TaxID=861533 RepID=A0ABX2KWZ5_9PROT|nr:CpaF family protein [Azospirillum formosense]MBY3754584.1 CpaF family protein [Azospirillum formosense]NUB18346.1 ATP-binding cassette domain-containing protein [Azospirillum formosense]
MFGRKVAEAVPDILSHQLVGLIPPGAPPCAPARISGSRVAAEDSRSADVLPRIRERVLEKLQNPVAGMAGRDSLRRELTGLVGDICSTERIPISAIDQDRVIDMLLDDMLGIGPIEPLLADDGVTDILVNGCNQIYVERRGKLELTGLRFRDDAHVINVAQRIASSVGRRVDESSPMVDARLQDGSRVNVILPPLALDGPSISIRKFNRRRVAIADMVLQGNLSAPLGRMLEVATACRLNVLVSGGTGSGKTTLLNALSRVIDPAERIVTIEDAAELQLQQPHVVRLETRPASIEGTGEITQRDLVKNALRMRPDRIIIGEVRGGEAFDLLQAMNTGHDGSMSTIHANRPRDALSRLESMVMMANGNLPLQTIRAQIASAVNLIVQVERMRDGVRRIQQVVEVVGMEGDVITTQELFTFVQGGGGEAVTGRFETSGVRPQFSARAAYYGLEDTLLAAMR